MTPEGWKMVPIEPTEEILGFGLDGWNGFASPRNKMCNAYRRMVAASPAPPVEESDDSVNSAMQIARNFAEDAIAQNIQWRLDPRYIIRLCDEIDRLRAALTAIGARDE